MKPIASSTSCASSSNSVPGIGLNLSSTCTQCSFATLPSAPEKFCVSTANSRLAPSAWLDEVRIFKGQFGQDRPLFSCSGGAAGQRQRVIFVQHLARIDRAGRRTADMGAVMKRDALGFHLRHPAVDDVL